MQNKLKITPIKNGPLMVEGQVKVNNSKNELIKEGDKLFICRCGGSTNKPFCDGTHNKIGFTD